MRLPRRLTLPRRSGRPHLAPWSALALGVSLVALVLLLVGGLIVLSVTWRSRDPQPEEQASHAAPADTPPGGQRAVDLPTPSPEAAALSDTATAEANRAPADREAVARQLTQLPNARWTFAAQRAQRQTFMPTLPVPRRVIPTIPTTALGFGWPLRGVITSTFSDEHPLGIDIAPGESLGLVLAARDGVVLVAGGDACCGYGYFVLLDHGNGLTSLYAHLRDAPSVRPGEWVERGTVLGVAGNTGKSEGVHLHFEVRVGGLPVDPQAVLTAGQLTPLQPRSEVAATAPAPEPSAAPAPSPAPADAQTEEPGAASPDPEDSAAQREDDSPSATAATGGSRTTSRVAAAAQPTRSPAPSPASSAPSSPASTPVATPSPSATPVPSATPTPSPTPTPNGGTSAQASSAQHSTPAATPVATPTSTPVASASPSPRPCSVVRFRTGAERAAGAPSQSSFVTLEADEDAIISLVAERCAADGPVTVIAKPVEGQRCIAALHGPGGELQRRLTLQTDESTGNAARDPGEVRWLLSAAEVEPGAIVRLTCAPSQAGAGG